MTLPPFRVGQGVDAHPLVAGRALVLGGVTVPFELGLDGHSDADVVAHAACDAVLGAAGLPDLGHHFPSADPRWKDASSIDLCRAVAGLDGVEASDEAALVELAGHPVQVVPGDPENLKVTTPLDLALAEELLARRGWSGSGPGRPWADGPEDRAEP